MKTIELLTELDSIKPHPIDGHKYRIKLIEKFKTKLCKKQRKLCAKNAKVDQLVDKVYAVNKDSILNAPEPK